MNKNHANKPLNPDIASILGQFKAIASSVENYTQRLVQQFEPVFEQLNKAIANVVTQPFTRELVAVIEALPELNILIDEWEAQADEAFEYLEEQGFPSDILDRVLTEWDVLRIARTEYRIRPAVATNTLLKLTRSDDFGRAILSRMASVARCRKRLPIVQQALKAHIDRSYFLSIPALLCQLEGLWEDAMFLRDEVMYVPYVDKKGRKGKNLKTRKGEKYVGTMDLKLKHSSFRRHPALDGSIELLSSAIVPNRDAIFHGQTVSYGKAKLSVQLLLVIFVIVSEIGIIES